MKGRSDMAALTYNTTSLQPARFERVLLTLADLLRAWAMRRMVRRQVFNHATEHRRDLHARMRIGL